MKQGVPEPRIGLAHSSFVDLAARSELLELLGEKVHVQLLDVLAEFTKPHLGQQYVVLIGISDRQRRPAQLEGADNIVVPKIATTTSVSAICAITSSSECAGSLMMMVGRSGPVMLGLDHLAQCLSRALIRGIPCEDAHTMPCDEQPANESLQLAQISLIDGLVASLVAAPAVIGHDTNADRDRLTLGAWLPQKGRLGESESNVRVDRIVADIQANAFHEIPRDLVAI